MPCQKMPYSVSQNMFFSVLQNVKKVTTISINPGFSLKQASGPFLQTNEIK